MLFKQVTLCLVSLMRVFCPEMDCLEGIVYGGGFVQGVLSRYGLCLEGVMYGGGFVRGGFVRGGFVRRGFCPCTVPTCTQIDHPWPFTNDL